MKILVIGIFNSYATTKPFVEVLLGLHQKGVELLVMSASKGKVIDYMVSRGIQVIDHHPKKKIDPISINTIKDYLTQEQPDILYLMNSRSIANGVRAAKGFDTKVVTYRGAAGLYWHDPTSYLTHLNPRVDKVVCLSEFVERNVRKQMPYMVKKTHVIKHGFDPNWYKADTIANLEQYGIPEGGFVVCCIANNRPVKGVKYLIRALNHITDIKNIYLLLIGEGISQEVDRERPKCKFPERIVVTGHVEDLSPLYSAIDVYVQPSLKEGLGKSIVEAMCCEKPVIATKSGGPEELIEHNISGILVDKKDPKAIASQIIRLYEDENLRRTTGQNALQRIKDNFSIEKSVSEYYTFFNSLSLPTLLK